MPSRTGVIAILWVAASVGRAQPTNPVDTAGRSGKATDPTSAATVDVPLAPLTVKGQRTRQPSLAEVLGRSMWPTAAARDSDLNHASAGMKSMIEKLGDADPTHHHAADGFAAGGEPPDRCAADLSQGCAEPQ